VRRQEEEKELCKMSADQPIQAGRRAFLGAGAAVLAGLAAPAWALQDAPEADTALGGTVRSNVSAFRALDWQDYFANTRNGVILCDTKSRALHFWSEDQTIYKLYPTSVPLTDDLTRLGKTEVVQKALSKGVPRTIRLVCVRCIFRGPPTAFMAPMTHARSAAGLPAAALAFTMNTSLNCLVWRRSEHRCC